MSERVEMDPVILSCAVRYALGRHSYLPGLVADEVRRTWPELGEQRTVIREDIARWLEQMGTSDYVMGAGWSTARPTWEQLLHWIDTRNASDVKEACPRCGSTKPSRRFSSDNGRTHCGHGWHSVPQDPETCACGKPATGTVGGVPTAAGFRVTPEPDSAADRTPKCPTCGSDDVAVRLAGCRGQQWELDVDPWHFNLPGYLGHREAPRADRTPASAADRIPNADCPNADQHTPCPDGYLAWHDWASRMSRTHRQVYCPGCDRWNIWRPRD